MSESQGHRPFIGYRPITAWPRRTDVWILARPKVPYYGAYPNGFLERARPLLGVTIHAPVLHVCGGRAREYPNKTRGFGPRDLTLDLDAGLEPDYCQPATDPLPRYDCGDATCLTCTDGNYTTGIKGHGWSAMLADPPYTDEDADKYAPGRTAMPKPNLILRRMLDAVDVGSRVGMLHYLLPQPPAHTVFVACVGVVVGFNNRMRVFSVFEKGAVPVVGAAIGDNGDQA